jgi:hypothetical protein
MSTILVKQTNETGESLLKSRMGRKLKCEQLLQVKMAVFWVVAPERGVIALMLEAARTSETLVIFYQTTRRYNPEDTHLRTHRRENLKS